MIRHRNRTASNILRGVALSFAALAGAAIGADDPPKREPPPADFLRTTRAPLAWSPLPADVERTPVRVGTRADGSELVAHVTKPRLRAGATAPVVLLLHGGLPDEVPVKPTEWRVYRDWGAALASVGVASVMFDHTLGYPRRRLDQAVGEIDTILAWLAADGRTQGLDAGRLALVGFSAGGLLIPELVAASRPLRPARIVLFYPSTGIAPGTPAAAVTDAALAGRMNLAQAAPRIADANIRVLVVRAGADKIPGLNALLDASVDALVAADADVTVVNVPGMPHAFDIEPAPRTSAAIRTALGFVAELASAAP